MRHRKGRRSSIQSATRRYRKYNNNMHSSADEKLEFQATSQWKNFSLDVGWTSLVLKHATSGLVPLLCRVELSHAVAPRLLCAPLAAVPTKVPTWCIEQDLSSSHAFHGVEAKLERVLQSSPQRDMSHTRLVPKGLHFIATQDLRWKCYGNKSHGHAVRARHSRPLQSVNGTPTAGFHHNLRLQDAFMSFATNSSRW